MWRVWRISHILPDRHWGPCSVLYNGYRVIFGGEVAGAWRWPPHPHLARERLEVFLYSPLCRHCMLHRTYFFFFLRRTHLYMYRPKLVGSDVITIHRVCSPIRGHLSPLDGSVFPKNCRKRKWRNTSQVAKITRLDWSPFVQVTSVISIRTVTKCKQSLRRNICGTP
jgi:hypothetical protein